MATKKCEQNMATKVSVALSRFLSRDKSRHFSIRDFQDMGKLFGETVLEYETVTENAERTSQVVLGDLYHSFVPQYAS